MKPSSARLERVLERQGTPAPAALIARRRGAAELFGQLPAADGIRAEILDAAGVAVRRFAAPQNAADMALLYFHGGGFRLGSAEAFSSYTSHLAAACRVEVISVDYRLAPENPYPAAFNDAITAYEWLLDRGTQASSVIIGGDSAGGGLAASLLLAIRKAGLAQPAGGVLLSPWLDLRNEADSFRAHAESDELFSLSAAQEAAQMYLAGYPASDPLVSPLLGDWSDQPPVLVHASSSEVLHDDSARLAAKLEAAGQPVDFRTYPDVPHVWHHSYPRTDASVHAVQHIASFVAERSGSRV